MLRSKAPSQRGVKRPNDKENSFLPPLESLKKPKEDARPSRAKTSAPKDVTNRGEDDRRGPVEESATEHEERIRVILSKPFKVPIANYTGHSQFSLGIRKLTVRKALHDPNEDDALVLYEPDQSVQPVNDPNSIKVHVVVDPVLCKVLRPHQREGVRFMYECLTGVKVEGHEGCIMADDMGLGKTLQCVTLVWTLLKQSPDAKPAVTKAVIVAPSSLVKNWANEFSKWLGPSKIGILVMDGGSKQDIKRDLTAFMQAEGRRLVNSLCVISYETFRIYSKILCSRPIGMVICDEGHRLKNAASQTYEALKGLQTKKRIIVSGTPIQNDLTEYFSLLDFVNPELLGTPQEFRKNYELPIMKGRDADATEAEQQRSQEKLNDLAAIVNKFIIRRTASINKKYLPTKVEQVVFCRMTELQASIYREFIKSKDVKLLLSDGRMMASSLQSITILKKLCNHPTLIWEGLVKGEGGLKGCINIMPKGFSPKAFCPEMSGKLAMLDQMLAIIKATTTDRVVLVSNYTQTLDLFELMCAARKYNYIRLDGSLSIGKRQQLVDRFNDPRGNDFLFLLSSKAGGCGLNLIGANRLVLYDPDWNPATDLQAMARVWRDGQKKRCYIYRLVTTGSLEEKIFQRQAHKQALSSCVVDEEENVERHFSFNDLRDLFKLNETTLSDTHDTYKCKRCVAGVAIRNTAMKVANESEELQFDMSKWNHYATFAKLEDTVLKQAAGNIVSFVFHNQFD